MKLYSVATLMLVASSVSAHRLTSSNNQAIAQRGIFSKMIELATAEDKVKMEQHEATERKKRQLEEAEAEHDKAVKEEEEEEEKEREKQEEEAQMREAKMREERQAKEHEDLLKQLAAQTDVQLVQQVDVQDLTEAAEQQLIEMDKQYKQKAGGGLFSSMEKKLAIHEKMAETSSALKTLQNIKPQNQKKDINFGAHGYTPEEPRDKHA